MKQHWSVELNSEKYFQLLNFSIRISADSSEILGKFRSIIDALGLPIVLPTGCSVPLQIHINLQLTPIKPPSETFPDARFDDIDIWRFANQIFIYHPDALFFVNLQENTIEGNVLANGAQTETIVYQDLLLLALMSLLRHHNVFALHAGCVTTGNRACMVIGESGCGKSTLVLALLSQGWQSVSDDSILLRYNPLQQIVAHPLRRKLLVFPDVLAHFAKTKLHLIDAKTSVDPQRINGFPVSEESTPQLLLFPKIVDQPESQLVPINKSDALYHLLRQSSLNAYDTVQTPAHMDLLKNLVQQSRCYRFIAGKDVLLSPADVSRKLLSEMALNEQQQVGS